jgi:hypothetical protein
MIAEYILYTLSSILIILTIVLYTLNHEYKKSLRRPFENREVSKNN